MMIKRKKVLMLLHPYHMRTHRAIAKVSGELGWHLQVNSLDELVLPNRWDGDGIICALNDNQRLENFVKEAEVPCVDLSIWREDLGYPRVSGDNVCIGQLAAEHFCAYGHTNFGWFSRLKNPVSRERHASYKTALEARGKMLPAVLTGKKVLDQETVFEWLHQLKKPTAIFAYNDIDAAWLLNCCLDAGYRVPEDFAIIGVDDNPLICELQITPLSSIKHDHARIGERGARLLDALMTGQEVESRKQFIQPSGISTRASTDWLATDHPHVQKAVAFMKNNLEHSIGTNDTAEFVGIRRRKLELCFKDTLGLGVHQMLLQLRLKKAEFLLSKSDEKVEEIAAMTGFCHAPHLCRVFKKSYGLTPQVYRSQSQRL